MALRQPVAGHSREGGFKIGEIEAMWRSLPPEKQTGGLTIGPIEYKDSSLTEESVTKALATLSLEEKQRVVNSLGTHEWIRCSQCQNFVVERWPITTPEWGYEADPEEFGLGKCCGRKCDVCNEWYNPSRLRHTNKHRRCHGEDPWAD